MRDARLLRDLDWLLTLDILGRDHSEDVFVLPGDQQQAHTTGFHSLERLANGEFGADGDRVHGLEVGHHLQGGTV